MLGRLLDRKALTVSSGGSPLGFSAAGSAMMPRFDRYLTISGKPAFHIGNVCGTCAFLFSRLEGANQTVAPAALSERLRQGIDQIDEEVMRAVEPILPEGRYVSMLSELVPRLVQPGSPSDYFSREQVDLWGIDPFWGLPHHPRTEYYRCADPPLGERRQLFEFVVPTYPKRWLRKPEVERYIRRMMDGARPTALAVSILDVKQPATWEGEPSITAHWCLAHYLADGNHKTFAASLLGRPLTVLSFLHLGESVASEEDVEVVLGLLERMPAQPTLHL